MSMTGPGDGGFTIPPTSPDKFIERHNSSALQGWQTAQSRTANSVGATVADVMFCSDSVWEGFSGVNSDNGVLFRRAAKGLATAYNASGRKGVWGCAGIWAGPAQFSALGASTELQNGLSLRSRNMPAGAAPATCTQVCDRILVYYRKVNAFAQGDILIKVDGGAGTQIATFKNTGTWCTAANGQELNVFDSGPLARGPHTISVEQITNGGFNGAAQWDGAYFCDGDFNAGVRSWNCSHFGYNFLSYNNNNNPALNVGYLSAIRQGLLTPALWLWGHGINEGVDTVALESRMRTAIADLRAAQLVAGTAPCSQVLVIPWQTSGKTVAQWNAMRDIYYKVGYELGVAVWDAAEAIGSAVTNTYNVTADNVHPNEAGHRLLGDWLVERLLAESSPTLPSTNVQATLDNLNVPTVTGLAASPAAPLVTVVNTVAATAAVTLALPATVAGVRWRIRAWGDLLNNTAAVRTFTFAVTIGGTTIASGVTVAQPISATRGRWDLDLLLSVQALAVEHVTGAMRIVPTGAANSFDTPALTTAEVIGTVDLTNGANVTLTITPSVADPNLDWRTLGQSLGPARTG